MSEPIRTVKQLHQALALLPPTKDGLIRVLRGQTVKPEPPKMLATAFRSTGWRLDSVWNAYSMYVATNLVSNADDDALLKEVLQLLAFGVETLAQHYGPGSRYLDVTYDPTIAMWFALNEPESYDIVRMPDFKTLIRNPDTIRYDTFVRYEPRKAPGWVYVLDVPKWDRLKPPAHGELIDLSDAEFPGALGESKRIAAQYACLICDDIGVDGGDLSKFCVADPFEVQWPPSGAAGIEAPTDAIFPDVRTDPWYRIMLAVPRAPMVDPIDGLVKPRRPIAVTVYGYSNHERHEEVLSMLRTVEPIHRNAALTAQPVQRERIPTTWTPEVVEAFATATIPTATPILLEGPVLSTSPPSDSGIWNTAVLADGIEAEVACSDLKKGGGCGTRSTENVIVYYSPLESLEWIKLGFGQAITVLRAVWLVRRGPCGLLHLIHEEFPDTRIMVSVQLAYQFDRSRGVCEYWFEGKWHDATGHGQFDLPLLVTLDLLRKLSHGEKPSSFRAGGLNSDGMWTLKPPVERGPVIRLSRVFDEDGATEWCVVRTVDGNEPYVVNRLYLAVRGSDRNSS